MCFYGERTNYSSILARESSAEFVLALSLTSLEMKKKIISFGVLAFHTSRKKALNSDFKRAKIFLLSF